MEVSWNNWALFRFGQILNCEYVDETNARAAEVLKLVSRVVNKEEGRLRQSEREAVAAFILAGIECAAKKNKVACNVTFEDCFALDHLLPKVLESFVAQIPKESSEDSGK